MAWICECLVKMIFIMSGVSVSTTMLDCHMTILRHRKMLRVGGGGANCT